MDLDSREKILKEVIIGYREVLHERYQYENIIKKYEVPKTIKKKTVDNLRVYYLNYIYPDYSKRELLNNAFYSLDGFSKHPQKLLNILLDTTKLVFKYGIYLPKILKTGLKALKTFKAATNFENILVNEAISKKINPPYDKEKINIFLKAIPLHEINTFINTSQSLFNTLHDRKLVKKIKEILKHLI